MRLKTIVSLAAAVALVSACESTGPKQTFGTLGGAAVGGLIGSQFGKGAGGMAATGLGVLLGGLVGSEIGKSMDRTDQLYAQRASQQAYAAPIGQQIVWNNPETGNRGTYTAVNEGYDRGGNYCREFRQTINVGGRNEQGYGTACRQPDGSWKITN